MHWTQTPEGRRRISARMRAYARSPEGKRNLKKRAAQGRVALSRQTAERRALDAAAASAHNNGGDPSHTKPHAPSGRAMLVALARPEAERRIVQLQREIEMLRLFLDKTKP